MSLWLKAHPECAKVHAKYKSFQEAARNKDEITKCLPVMVGIPKVTCSPTNKNDCKIDESQACPQDGYECKNATANSRSEFWGTCSDGTKCLAMKLTDFIPYVISQYSAMKAFGCKPL